MKSIAFLAAAAVAFSSFGLSVCQAQAADAARDPAAGAAAAGQPAADADAQPAKATVRQGSTTQPSAFMLIVPVPIDRVVVPPVVPVGGALAPDIESIRDTLASATEAALAEDGFDDFVERLVDADRNRIGEAMPSDVTAFNVAAARVREAFQARFNTELDIEEEGLIYGPWTVVQGVITRPMAPAVKTMPENEPGDYNLEPGREVAVVAIPGFLELSDTTVVMIDEAYGWKIDVPNTMIAPRLYTNLVAHLNALAANVEHWPADREAAIRHITHHVLLGAIGQEPEAAAPGAAAAGTERR